MRVLLLLVFASVVTAQSLQTLIHLDLKPAFNDCTGKFVQEEEKPPEFTTASGTDFLAKLVFDPMMGNISHHSAEYNLDSRQSLNIGEGYVNVKVAGPSGAFEIDSDCTIYKHTSEGFFACKNAEDPGPGMSQPDSQPHTSFDLTLPNDSSVVVLEFAQDTHPNETDTFSVPIPSSLDEIMKTNTKKSENGSTSETKADTSALASNLAGCANCFQVSSISLACLLFALL